MNTKFYLLYKYMSFTDVAFDEDGTAVPVVRAILCNTLNEAVYTWEKRVSNFTGGPVLLGFMSSMDYLDNNNYAPMLDDDLTE